MCLTIKNKSDYAERETTSLTFCRPLLTLYHGVGVKNKTKLFSIGL